LLQTSSASGGLAGMEVVGIDEDHDQLAAQI